MAIKVNLPKRLKLIKVLQLNIRIRNNNIKIVHKIYPSGIRKYEI
jgi:hypothetical protein